MSFLFTHFTVVATQIASDSIDAQLQYAERIKSSDSERFSQILASLNDKLEQLSIDQKYAFLFLSGYESAYNGDIPKAIKLYQHVERNSRNINLRYKASASLINLYSLRKDWENGFRYLDLINNNYEKVEDIYTRHFGLIGASIFYSELEQYEMTQIFVNRLLNEEVSGRNLCMTLNLKMRAAMATTIETVKEEQVFEAINVCSDVNEPILSNVIRADLGRLYLFKNKPEVAIELLQNHYEESVGFNYPFLTIEVTIALAKAYRNANDLVKAREYAQKVANNQHAKDYIKRLVEAFEILSEYELAQGNYKNAVEYQNKYIEAKESLFEEVKAKQIAIKSSEHRAKEQANQIKILNNQNRILQLEKKLSQETATYNRWLIILLLLSVTILTLWIIYVKRSQQKLKYLAEYDSLTGISNRAYFTQSAETVLNYYSKTSRTACLVLFDLDHFKKVNDTYGHPAGDKVLEIVAVTCKASVRKVDIFGRVGGEEFAILLPGCEIDQAIKIAEDCRKRIAEIDPNELGIESPITASFGIAESSSTGYLLKDLIANADEAMYLAKRRGRNRVVSYSPD